MSSTAKPLIDWDVLDVRQVDALGERPLADVLAQLAGHAEGSPEDWADDLVRLAIDGRIAPLQQKTAALGQWASDHGLRRLENTLIELDRVLALPTRGQAVLQAQALTRFLRLHISGDIQALTDAISRC